MTRATLLGDARVLGTFDYAWPDAVEHFTRGWDVHAEFDGERAFIRHGVNRRFAFGRERVHSVTWVDAVPVVEGTATETYPTRRSLASVLKLPNGRDAQRVEDVDGAYRQFQIVVHREVISGPYARRGLAVEIREDDLASWATYAMLRRRQRAGPRSVERRPGTPLIVARPSVTDRAAVVAALLDHGRELAAPGPQAFTTNAAADAFVRDDPFAFLVGVICDEQVRFSKAWDAPLELRRRLGHWSIRRIASDSTAVSRVFAEDPKLHRWVSKTAARVNNAARRVVDVYGGDAARIWSGAPRARDLRARLEMFDGIGQKKAAMAMELLGRGLGVPISALDGSDVAVDVHVRRVFMRSGLVDRDDVVTVVNAARELHSTRPGELDNPAWDIGLRWCHAGVADCVKCAISAVCPKIGVAPGVA